MEADRLLNSARPSCRAASVDLGRRRASSSVRTSARAVRRPRWCSAFSRVWSRARSKLRCARASAAAPRR
eukprot:1226599-Pleurochrysis_carterae.AAC.1